MKIILFLITPALALMATAHAQERSAGQNYDAQSNWSALNGKIDAVINQNKLLATTIDKMKTCNDKNKIYNPKPDAASGLVADADGCTKPSFSSKDVITMVASADVTKGHGRFASYAVATCPAGTIRVACAGSRSPSYDDTCEEDKCGLVGAGPYGANGCITTVDDDKGTRATAWATCIKQN